MSESATSSRLSWVFGFLLLTWLAMWLITLTAPPDLFANNERRMAAYVLDAVKNGNWVCQRLPNGEIASKPPLQIWIAALATASAGRISRFTLYFPSAVATLVISWVIFAAGRARFGAQTGLSSALMYLVSFAADSQLVTARYDGFFTLPVLLGALAAFRAWETSRGWTWFWLACAAATLTKGPLGLVLAALGLLAAVWEKRTGNAAPIRGSHWVGIALFLFITVSWFALAYQKFGQELIDKMIGKELIAHAVGKSDAETANRWLFFMPVLDVFLFFAPWSLFAGIAFWRIWKHPADDANERRFERFLFCWFFAGLIIFMIAGHHRGRLIFPIIPPAALLAGRELARRWTAMTTRKLMTVSITIAIGGLLFVTVLHHVIRPHTSSVKRSLGFQKIAATIRESVGEDFPLLYVDDTFILQFYLNTKRNNVSFEHAAELLRSNTPTFVAVNNLDKLEKTLGEDAKKLHILLRWPADDKSYLAIVSNHPRLEWTEKPATATIPQP